MKSAATTMIARTARAIDTLESQFASGFGAVAAVDVTAGVLDRVGITTV
jgi:hypothetical protein